MWRVGVTGDLVHAYLRRIMRISVIVPIYNVEKYLRQCLDSVIAQTFSDWEMILVDDGSTDRSGSIADEYAAADDRIAVIHQKNAGLSAARNAGIDAACGEYIYFLDSDDYIVENTFEILYNTANNTGVELLVFNGMNFSEDDNGRFIKQELLIEEFKSWKQIFTGSELFCRMLEENSLLMCCVYLQIVRRDSLLRSGIRFKEGMLHEDNLYSFRLFMAMKSSMVIDKVLYMRRIRQGSITNNPVTIKNLEGLNTVYSEVTELSHSLNLSYHVRKYVNQYLRFFFMGIAKNYYVLNKRERKNFFPKYNAMIKMAKSNNYNYNINVKIICSFRHIYGLYKTFLIKFMRLRHVCLRKNKICYVRFSGGLGNQMFQYAFYKCLKQRGCKVYADLSSYRYDGAMPFELDEVFKKVSVNKIFCKKGILTDAIKKFIYVGKCSNCEKNDSWYDKNILEDITGGVYIGYWQTEKYFTGIERELRQDFRFGYGEENLKALADELRRSNSVSVHIRRGDYLDIQDVYGGICTMEYYANAIDRIKTMAGQDVQFYFFSNDIEWVKTQFKGDNYHYISEELFESYEDWYDMCLMSSCRHNIIANSSFSWWGAWLNDNEDKIVIAPSKWLNTGETPDIWCDGWIRI